MVDTQEGFVTSCESWTVPSSGDRALSTHLYAAYAVSNVPQVARALLYRPDCGGRGQNVFSTEEVRAPGGGILSELS